MRTHTVPSDSSPTKLGNQPNTQTPTFPASRTRIQLLRPSGIKEKNSLNSKGHPLPEPELPTPPRNPLESQLPHVPEQVEDDKQGSSPILKEEDRLFYHNTEQRDMSQQLGTDSKLTPVQ